MPRAGRPRPSTEASATGALRLDAAHARRFFVLRQLLAPPRSLPARPGSVLEVVRRLGSLQFDPLEVPGARNHDLVLHARIAGYRREWCERWLYPPRPSERRLIELYNKSLNLLPVDELPYFRIAWSHAAERYDRTLLRDHAGVAKAMLERIAHEGPLSTGAFTEHSQQVDWWWAPTRVGRAVLEALFVTGRIGIARREGNRRFYDLIEKLVPPELLARRATPEEAHRHRLLSRFRGVGLMAAGGASELIAGTGSATERARITAQLVDEGVLAPVEVEGLRERRYLLRDELDLLEASRRTAVPEAVTFLAPLDPFMWDRRLVRTLFGFEYVWEVYTPEVKRRHGYYVLPLLFGDRVVGRVEPRVERGSTDLHLLGLWFEEGFAPLEQPGFLGAFDAALSAYIAFVGAKRVRWPRTRLGRSIAARSSLG